MMPYKNPKLVEDASIPARFESNLNRIAVMNSRNSTAYGDRSTSFAAPVVHLSQNSNAPGDRSLAYRSNQMPGNFSDLSMSIPQSTQIMVNSHDPMVRSVLSVHPSSGFISQWQNQEMAFGVLSVPMGHTIPASSSIGQDKSIQLISSGKKVGIVEKRMYRSDQIVQQVGPPPFVQKKRNFQFAFPTESETSEKSILKKEAEKKNVPFDGRHFVGTVEQVIRWYNAVKTFDIFPMFQVHGVFEAKHTKPQDITILTIKQASGGPTLQGIFCAIDRPFPQHFQPGDNIVCVGKMKGAKKMQVMNAWRESAKCEDYTRVSFLCQRALQEFVMSASKP